MPVTNYRTLNGRMRGQTTANIRTDYLTDAIGSVTATVTASAVVENTYRHKPYGGQLSKTGPGVDPRFLWTGDTGSRTTGGSHAEQYNRARHYGAKQAGWTSADPLWPYEIPYGYTRGNPTSTSDPSGMFAKNPFGCDLHSYCGAEDPCAFVNEKCAPGSECEKNLLRCMKDNWYPTAQTKYALDFIRGFCSGNPSAKGAKVCVACPQSRTEEVPNWPSECEPWVKHCGRWVGGYQFSVIAGPKVATIPGERCVLPYGSEGCQKAVAKLGCDQVLVLCPSNDPDLQNRKCSQTVFHELAHAAGFGGKQLHNDENFDKKDFPYQLGRCLCRQKVGILVSNFDPCSIIGSRLW